MEDLVLFDEMRLAVQRVRADGVFPVGRGRRCLPERIQSRRQIAGQQSCHVIAPCADPCEQVAGARIRVSHAAVPSRRITADGLRSGNRAMVR
jgi:hypothetical protein